MISKDCDLSFISMSLSDLHFWSLSILYYFLTDYFLSHDHSWQLNLRNCLKHRDVFKNLAGIMHKDISLSNVYNNKCVEAKLTLINRETQ